MNAKKIWNHIFPPEIGDKVELTFSNEKANCIVRGELVQVPDRRSVRAIGRSYIIDGSFTEIFKDGRIEKQKGLLIEVGEWFNPKIELVKRKNR